MCAVIKPLLWVSTQGNLHADKKYFHSYVGVKNNTELNKLDPLSQNPNTLTYFHHSNIKIIRPHNQYSSLNMDCYLGSRDIDAFFFLEYSQDFIFLPRKSLILLKYVQNKKQDILIISSYCCRRSVPVGVPTLHTSQNFFKYT